MRFLEVDWFHDISQEPAMVKGDHRAFSISTPEGRGKLEEMLRTKDYFDEHKAYLVLCPMHSFTINYHAV